MAIDVGFYHCSRAPAAEVAVRLAAKAHAAGQRLLVVGLAEVLEQFDQALWVQDRDSFLPHGMAGGAHDADQPILLSPRPHAANGARLLMLLGHGLPAEFDGFDRLLNIFDDGMPDHQRARSDWKAIASRSGVERSYWQQTASGGWEKKG